MFLGTNPVYDAPADLKFGELLQGKKPKTTIHVGSYDDETGRLCDWHFPLAHELECWGDARAHDGTVSISNRWCCRCTAACHRSSSSAS